MRPSSLSFAATVLRCAFVYWLSVSLTFGLESPTSSRSSCPTTEFDDLASRTIISPIVFLGTFLPPDQQLNPLDVSNDRLVTASFRVEQLYKGELPRDASNPAQYRTVLAGALRPDGSAEDCLGLGGLRKAAGVAVRYVVFLNGSSWVGAGGREVRWAGGRVERETQRADAEVTRHSCRTCAGQRHLYLFVIYYILLAFGF